MVYGSSVGLDETTGHVFDQSWPGGEHEGLNEYFGQALVAPDKPHYKQHLFLPVTLKK